MIKALVVVLLCLNGILLSITVVFVKSIVRTWWSLLPRPESPLLSCLWRYSMWFYIWPYSITAPVFISRHNSFLAMTHGLVGVKGHWLSRVYSILPSKASASFYWHPSSLQWPLALKPWWKASPWKYLKPQPFGSIWNKHVYNIRSLNFMLWDCKEMLCGWFLSR